MLSYIYIYIMLLWIKSMIGMIKCVNSYNACCETEATQWLWFDGFCPQMACSPCVRCVHCCSRMPCGSSTQTIAFRTTSKTSTGEPMTEECWSCRLLEDSAVTTSPPFLRIGHQLYIVKLVVIPLLGFALSCIFSLKANQIHWGKAVLPCCVLLLFLDKSIETSIHLATPLWR